MPGGDRTGPMGQGPMTGRRLGFCIGSDLAELGNRFFGRGFGRGRGIGFRRYSPPIPETYPVQYSTENEAELLRLQAQDLKTSLKNIEDRLVQLEKKSSKKEDK
jgi:hypothetical protein